MVRKNEPKQRTGNLEVVTTAVNSLLDGGGQADNVVTFGHEGRGFEFSHGQSNSTLGIPLFAVALLLKNVVHRQFNNEEIKR